MTLGIGTRVPERTDQTQAQLNPDHGDALLVKVVNHCLLKKKKELDHIIFVRVKICFYVIFILIKLIMIQNKACY